MWEREWLEGKISREEAINRAGEVDDIVPLLKSAERVSDFNVRSNLSEAQAWELLEKKILAQKKPKVIIMSRKRWITGVAASFIFLIGALFLLTQSDQTIVDTASAESNTVSLPAGSLVYLNANSTLNYTGKLWKEERFLELEGEAFFEVTKGNRFVVSTEHGIVEVLGTSFNVRVRNERMEVSCKTGKVSVTSPDKKSSQIITPGWKVVAQAGVVSKPVRVAVDQVDNWRDGDYDFESVQFTEVLEEFERQFNFRLEYNPEDPNIRNRVYNGYFSSKNMTEAIQMICQPMGLRYEINKSSITISSAKQ